MAKRLIKSINIMSVSGDTQGIERIDSQIKALILSMVGTIPGSRGFGLEREFISRPPQEALNLLAIELEENSKSIFQRLQWQMWKARSMETALLNRQYT